MYIFMAPTSGMLPLDCLFRPSFANYVNCAALHSVPQGSNGTEKDNDIWILPCLILGRIGTTPSAAQAVLFRAKAELRLSGGCCLGDVKV